jgi:hypothetical protein
VLAMLDQATGALKNRLTLFRCELPLKPKI